MKILTPAERLIVAADFKPDPTKQQGRQWVFYKVLAMADSLKGTGVYLKVNSALRSYGYDLIGEIQLRGLRVFADLKLIDIGETLATDGVLLRQTKPELLTTVCTAGNSALQALKAELPDTEVLGVTVLTDESNRTYGMTGIQAACMMLAAKAVKAGLGGIISSANEAEMVRRVVGTNMTINTPAIRPKWAMVAGDDQNPARSRTPAEAIKAGADRIVVGRPIVRAENPRDAVMRTIEEIASAVAEIGKRQDCPSCPTCGHTTVRNGACFKCLNCGESVGCS